MFAFAKGALSIKPGVTPPGFLHRNGRFDRRMRVATEEFEIFEHKVVNVFDGRIQLHVRQPPAIAGKLLARLVKMIVVEMQITESVDEISGTEIDHLSDHHREQRVRRDIKRNAKKQIGAALVQLAT